MEFDFNALTQALNVAGQTGTNVGHLANGIGSLKALFQKSEAAADADIKLALSELTSQVADTKLANAELKTMLQNLQEELAAHQAFKSDLERYSLWETPVGSIVYRLRDSAKGEDPMHYLCPNCIEDKRKSILQGHEHNRRCPSCSTLFRFKQMDAPQPVTQIDWLRGF
jgi:rubrerythrin